jgi:hypothetical protein
VTVRADKGRRLIQVQSNNGNPDPPMPIAFYGPDRAVVTEGSDRGQGVEFVRDDKDSVRWIRITGRVAVRN